MTGSAFLKPCPVPGCGIATYGATCDGHSRPTTRNNSYQRGYGRAHARWRKAVLAADPICHWPLEDGTLCLEPATVADHVIPWKRLPESKYSLDNGQGLCAAHHNRKTAEEKQGIYRSTR